MHFCQRLPVASAAIVLVAGLLVGCGSESAKPTADTNDIQSYIDANPDKVDGPDSSPVDEASEFAAGDG
ncbi:hypothetical protein NHH03_11365 [Stieleria sp. TO1_6]|uniref:hypothetical protein n=1 Tax=Stieleria tagensis TaxID=2956795 RepID=UPI00209BA9A4|nr:hypothetical protein [Stieleria tagensis]MCO8122340.1 hypothetical protein [Stieleria tagensis]